MPFDNALIGHVAFLARLRLSEEQARLYSAEFPRILELIREMDAAEVEGVEPLYHPLERRAPLRTDRVIEADARNDYRDIAPAMRGGCYRVPRFLE